MSLVNFMNACNISISESPMELFAQKIKRHEADFALVSSDFETSPARDFIIYAVGMCIENVNLIVEILQMDGPVRSDILEVVYSGFAVRTFFRTSEETSEILRRTSVLTSNWFTAISDEVSANLVRVKNIDSKIEEISLHVRDTQQKVNGAREMVNQAQRAVNEGRDNVEEASRGLHEAQGRLEERRREQSTVRTIAFATIFIPVVSATLFAVSLTAMEDAVNSQRDAVRSFEHQLSEEEDNLARHRRMLQNEQNSLSRLKADIDSNRQEKRSLEKEIDAISKKRSSLISVSGKINDCIHAVDGALGSSVALGDALSLSSIPTNIRGLLQSLEAESMFSQPLSQFHTISFEGLDRCISSMRKAHIKSTRKGRGLVL